MEREKKASIGKVVGSVFQSVFKLFKDITQLASAEAQLAKASLVNLFLMTFVLAAILTSTWLCLLGLLIAYLLSIKLSLLLSLGIVAGLNVLLLVIAIAVVLKLKSNLFFPATRKQLYKTKNLLKETYRERITKKN